MYYVAIGSPLNPTLVFAYDDDCGFTNVNVASTAVGSHTFYSVYLNLIDF